ncbi:MAG: tetratricopeptide repeat protein, partial [Bacteroidales bacterium]
KTEYQKAAGLKPEENYPQERISEINSKLEALAAVEEAYNMQIAGADALFNAGSYDEARSSYEKALEIKPGETYPATQIDEIENLLAALAKKREEYNSLVSTGDFHFDAENFQKAKNAYEEAAALFPEETYPGERLREIDAIMLAEFERIQKEYNRAIKEADRFFNSKVYDNAIHYYTMAAAIMPDESYPEDRIREITRILEENVVVNVVQNNEVIEADQLSTFRFDPVPRQGRKESYVVVKAKNLGDRDFRLFLNYGKGNSKNGGFVINIPKSGNMRDYIVKVGGQYKWFSEDNDWISLQPEGGSVEVSLIQVSQE